MQLDTCSGPELFESNIDFDFSYLEAPRQNEEDLFQIDWLSLWNASCSGSSFTTINDMTLVEEEPFLQSISVTDDEHSIALEINFAMNNE
jgi:hypothetical protein